MASYMNSNAAVPLSVPLNKCNHGTVLHVSHTTEAMSYLLLTAESEKRIPFVISWTVM